MVVSWERGWGKMVVAEEVTEGGSEMKSGISSRKFWSKVVWISVDWRNRPSCQK